MGEVTYSYSRLDTFEQCQFKYRLKYEEKHYLFCNSVATELGTLVHETEEAIANCLKDGTAIDYITLKNNFIKKAYELKHKYAADFNTKDKSDRTYDDKIYGYLNAGIYKLEQFMKAHPTYEIVGIEQPFEIDYAPEKKFKGFIDRVFYDTATDLYVIQDIKTYAVPLEHDKLTTPLQFVVYTMAAKALWNCTEANIKCQYYLPFCDLTQDAGTKGFIARGCKKLDELFVGIDAKDCTPNPTPLCAWCEYSCSNPNAPEEGKYLCPYFCHWTREKKDFSKENEWQGKEAHGRIMESYLKKVQKS